MQFHRKLLLVLLLLPVASCSQNKPIIERTGEYRVEVSTNGKKIDSAATSRFVHYLSLSEESIVPFCGFSPASEVVLDGSGNVIGLLLGEAGSAKEQQFLESFQLQREDTLTAFGKDHLHSNVDLQLIACKLYRDREGTLTFIRSGRPHKTYMVITPKKQNGKSGQ